jgi:hypothetical protein
MRNLALVLLLPLAGCASSGGTGTPDTTETVRVVDGTGSVTNISMVASAQARAVQIEAPPAQVWSALTAVYLELGIDAAHSDARTRTIGNPGLRLRRRLANVPLSRYLDCGRTQGGASADSYEINASIHSTVQAHPDQTSSVQTTLSATAHNVNFGGAPVRCTSTGELEVRIAGMVLGRLSQ